ncbi:venom allergen 2-like isoform X2 [Odontomachus brunneus]|uniref:venom allergen 2-like isoform X2 n=1 Tax=Odontomachus brunneus TaxID=486640 RepID=UPI0013F22D58|nr:venom allergen 2-like isoform X2 [Odontomachus brunneus]
MKTLMIIVTVLSVITIVYGINQTRLKKYHMNFAKCLEEKGGTAEKPSPEAVVCLVVKDGDILNANGEYTREKAMKGIEDAISDPSTIQKAKAMYNKCHDEAEQSGVTGYEQTIKIAGCSSPVLAFFDKI